MIRWAVIIVSIAVVAVMIAAAIFCDELGPT